MLCGVVCLVWPCVDETQKSSCGVKKELAETFAEFDKKKAEKLLTEKVPRVSSSPTLKKYMYMCVQLYTYMCYVCTHTYIHVNMYEMQRHNYGKRRQFTEIEASSFQVYTYM